MNIKQLFRACSHLIAVMTGLACVQPANAQFTRADTLRGSITAERVWWDVKFYDLHVSVNPADSSISGYNRIVYEVIGKPSRLQIDLQMPLVIDSIIQDGKAITFERDGNAFFADVSPKQRKGSSQKVTVYYHGKPHVAKKAPWDGGVVWAQDSLGNPWISTACQGVGASIWWPNKDTQADEPDSQRVSITVPEPLVAVSNGRLRNTIEHDNGTRTYEWFVGSPINNYNVSINAGVYTRIDDIYDGEAGTLGLTFWPLAYHADTAKAQFQQAKPMLSCFESWFGPYPWYKDGYQLIETPYLGMEHQSGIAYGNHYVNGYRGRDLSESGWGLRWDFILVHESGHEWFGNNITTKDIADMWVHESFTNYSEGLYTECQFGKEAGAQYIIGLRRNVQNDEPITGAYGVNDEGSGDMYYKGSNMLHTMRQIIDDDTKWRQLLRGLNKAFWHQTVTGRQVQEYINEQSRINFDKLFAQYLTTMKIPKFQYRISGDTVSYRWVDVVSGFDMPLKILVGPQETQMIRPTESWQTMQVPISRPEDFRVDENFYVVVERVR